MVNPYYIYIVTFLFSILIYQLGWSTLFPTLKLPLILFLISSIIGSFFLGFFLQLKRIIEFKPIGYHKRIPPVFYFISVLWILSFIYNRGIPLLLVLSGAEYNYTEFGIPSLHVFIVTFTSFFSCYLFHVYISTKRRDVLVYFLLTMIFPVLLFNRGMLLINIVSCLFLYLQYINGLSFRKIFPLVCFLLLVLYGFGVLGNIRLARPGEDKYSSKPILSISKANEDFIESKIPSEFIWSYLYLSSPLGNLQHNIDIENTLDFSPRTLVLFFNNEFLFDFISKRLNLIFDATREHCLRFADFLTVGTTYSNSYIYLGWIGVLIMGAFIMFFPLVYLSLLKKRNVLYVTGTSILGSLYLFLIFDNMFAFTGLSFQLVYPLIFGFLFRSKN